MLRRLVRSYYRIRYFPRLVVQMLTGIASGVAALRDAPVAATPEPVEIDIAPLRDLQLELSSFLDGSTRYMMSSTATGADHGARLAALGAALQRLEAIVPAIAPKIAGGVRDAETSLQDALRLHQAEVSELRGDLAAMANEMRERHADLAETFRTQATEMGRIERMTAQQMRLQPSVLWAPETSVQVREILSLLKPMAAPGIGKIRIGRDHDGGYVMLDDFAGVGAALSLGIADDVSWDSDIAAYGIELFQFDPSVEAPPSANDHFHFEALRVVPQDVDGGISIATILRERVQGTDSPLLLKIDIEGAEWDVLLGLDAAIMPRFKQIVAEFHDLDRLAEPEFGARARDTFAKLARTHAVVHVHGNNCGNFANVGNVMVPQSLELSFALRSDYVLTDEVLSFPTPLDRPNQPGRADLFLGSFRFEAEETKREPPAMPRLRQV